MEDVQKSTGEIHCEILQVEAFAASEKLLTPGTYSAVKIPDFQGWSSKKVEIFRNRLQGKVCFCDRFDLKDINSAQLVANESGAAALFVLRTPTHISALPAFVLSKDEAGKLSKMQSPSVFFNVFDPPILGQQNETSLEIGVGQLSKADATSGGTFSLSADKSKADQDYSCNASGGISPDGVDPLSRRT